MNFLFPISDFLFRSSYFLFSIKLKDLDFIDFPLGDFTKNEIRNLAKKMQFHLHDKADSQDICFVPDGDYKKFIKKNIKNSIKGEIVDLEDNAGGQYVYEFRVWNVFNRITRDRKQTYTLGLISEYGLLNEGIRINKKIEGNTSLQVVKMLTEYLKVPIDLIDSEASSTTIKVLPTKKTPYSLIRSLLPKTISEKTGNAIQERQAISSGSNESSSDVNTVEAEKATGTAGYFFFQTNRGFTFRSIDSLVSSDESFNGTPPVGKPFIYNWSTDTEPTLYRIQEIVFGQELNMLKKKTLYLMIQLPVQVKKCLRVTKSIILF